MGSHYAMAVGESVAYIPGIETLNLSGNRITDSAAAAILMDLRPATSLRHLDMSQNRLDIKTAAALENMLQTTQTLVSLHLEQNQLHSRAIQRLCHGKRIYIYIYIYISEAIIASFRISPIHVVYLSH
jgi:Ran GTPase-activating protein (RanGAP) involved in mRNA processing and transport